MTIIANTCSLIGNVAVSMPFDVIVAPIRQTGQYIGLVGNLIECRYIEFHNQLQKEMELHPAKADSFYLIKQPHDPANRTFDAVLYAVDNDTLELHTLIEQILFSLLPYHFASVGLPLLRFAKKPTDAPEVTDVNIIEEILLGIRNFQHANHDMYVYLALTNPSSKVAKLVFEQTIFCGEWNAGNVVH